MKILAIGVLTLIVVQGLAEILIYLKGRSPQPGTPKTILVLGANPDSRLLKIRLQKAFELARQFTEAKILMSGNRELGEIDFMMAEAAKAGFQSRTFFEADSRTTQDNLKNSLPLVAPPVIVVTNGFHQRRAIAIARELNYDLVHVETRVQDAPTRIWTFLRERAAVLKTAVVLLQGLKS